MQVRYTYRGGGCSASPAHPGRETGQWNEFLWSRYVALSESCPPRWQQLFWATNIFWGNRVSFKFTGQPELTSCTSLIKIVIPYVTILLCGTTREKADVEVGVHQAEGLRNFRSPRSEFGRRRVFCGVSPLTSTMTLLHWTPKSLWSQAVTPWILTDSPRLFVNDTRSIPNFIREWIEWKLVCSPPP